MPLIRTSSIKVAIEEQTDKIPESDWNDTERDDDENKYQLRKISNYQLIDGLPYMKCAAWVKKYTGWILKINKSFGVMISKLALQINYCVVVSSILAGVSHTSILVPF